MIKEWINLKIKFDNLFKSFELINSYFLYLNKFIKSNLIVSGNYYNIFF